MNVDLTTVERDVLQLRADGFEGADIAIAVGISRGYVKNLTAKICKKLGADNMCQAVAMGIRRRLIS